MLEAETCETRVEHPDAVRRARQAMPTEGATLEASLILKAVSDVTRLKLLSALAVTELCVCDLAAIAGTSESAVSHQLRLLRERRLVTGEKRGREVYYRIKDAHVTALISSALEHAREG
jgi:ArsR family transcriptional regulator